MRLPGASQWVCDDGARDGARGARTREARNARRRVSMSMRRDGLRLHEREKEKRYPIVPVQAIALEPEQQGGTGPDI